MARIYVASSWRNEYQPEVVERLRGENHAVYDFRNPPSRAAGFSWADLDPDWKNWTVKDYRAQLMLNPRASHGYVADLRAMSWADTCVMVLPCGNSAHLEAGWFAGAHKRLFILALEEHTDPDLMYLLADGLVTSYAELFEAITAGCWPLIRRPK